LPDLVPFRGHCLVRRSEFLQLHGAWTQALELAEQASQWLSGRALNPDAGAAFYQVGEIHRLRGKFAESEEAYRQASQFYRCPGPGAAQLRLAQGRVDAANTMIRRLAEEVRETPLRARLLPAYADIVLAANDTTAARAAAAELMEIAGQRQIPFLQALSKGVCGAVLLAEGKVPDALAELRQSWSLWLDLEAPYEAARAQFLIALACRELGDDENAHLELVAAREVFRRLEALVDLSRVDALIAKNAGQRAGPLTDREVQVLRLIASGMTNRGIAGKLKISEKTVARHVSNIFTKLDLSSRSAATAYAYDHDLV
jgi:ATP/maltotriose-dependent transcriptional regulator MalT